MHRVSPTCNRLQVVCTFQTPFALACAGAQLGLPELTLGILPGFGGTQRLPRLVGLQKGVQMILTSKPIKSQEGLKAGLVDAVVEPPHLIGAAKQFARDMAAGIKHRPFTLYRCGIGLCESPQSCFTARDMALPVTRCTEMVLLTAAAWTPKEVAEIMNLSNLYDRRML